MIILLLGATGFIGKVLLERLLHDTDVKAVYVLMRGSKKFPNVEERFEHEVKGSKCFENCQDLFHKTKVTPIEGDITNSENMGMDQLTTELVLDSITHILNLAADVSFDKPLLEATKSNVEGPMNAISLAKKCQNLCSFVHCSTAYVFPSGQTEGAVMKEEITGYFKETSGTAIYETIQSKIYLKEEEDSLLERSKLPNTYAFSKALVESMLCENHGNIPLTIVRPSIVGPSLSHPHAGWVDSVSAISAYTFFYGGGFIHFYCGKPDVLVDVVPCDYVAYCLLQAAKNPSEGSSIDRVRIINATAGKKNSLTVRNWSNAAVLFFSKSGRKTFLKPFPRSNFLVSDKLDVERQRKKDTSRINTRIIFLKATGQMQAAKKLDRVSKSIAKVVHNFEAYGTGFWNFESSMELNKLYPEFEKDAYSELLMQGVFFYLLRSGLDSKENLRPSNIPERKGAGTNVPKKANVNHDTT